MNYQGSSKHLLRNSRSALLASIEIYNKPSFQYRDESFVILLLNAWELLLKAIISKDRGSIYYKKNRNEPYRTLSMDDAFVKAEKSLPEKVQTLPIRANLSLLSTYRDNAVHFYNEQNFGRLIYALAQTSILNFRDLLLEVFGKKLTDDISWQLMPLGLEPPIDPITYLSQPSKGSKRVNGAVSQFLETLAINLGEIEKSGFDTGKVITNFSVSLNSVKKIHKSDVVVGIDGSGSGRDGPLVITKIKDPNITHPHRTLEVLKMIGNSVDGKKFTSHTFQAVCYKFGFKDKPNYCWKSIEGALTKYSPELIAKIKSLSSAEIDDSLNEYKKRKLKN